jgi:acetolactate synthase I/II/III large subunit
LGTVAHQIITGLVDAGQTHIFGVVGTTTLPLLDVLHDRNDIAYVSCRHEQVAASAADGYARMTRKPGIVFVQGGSGVTNLLLSTCIAWKDHVPMIILAGMQGHEKLGRDSWQEINCIPIFASVTKWAYRVNSPREIPWVMRKAFIAAVAGRAGPVLLEIPREVLAAEAVNGIDFGNAGEPVTTPWSRPAASGADVSAAAAALQKANRPLLVLGGGVLWSGAIDAARALVDTTRLPVLTTGTARGVIPEDHPCYAGYPGRLGDKSADAAMSEADCVVAVGVRLTDLTTSDWTLPRPDVPLFQVNIDPNALGREMPATRRIEADAGLFLSALKSELGNQPHKSGKWAEDRHAVLVAERASHMDYSTGKLTPEALLAQLSRHIRKDALLTVGAGIHTRYFNKLLVREAPGNLHSVGLGSMCLAFPAAIGAKLVAPQRQVVCLVGDGDFAMTMQDLETIARLNLDIKIVVYNNGSYGQKEVQNREYRGRIFGTEHGNPDFGAAARLFGLSGRRVEKAQDLASAVDELFATPGTVVLDVVLDPFAMPKGMMI